MNIYIKNGIQLPAFDVEMLSQGKLIIVPFIKTLKQGQTFWLYPSQKLPHNLSLEEYYQPQYLTSAKSALDRYTKFPLNLITWARCEKYWRINPSQKYLLPKIAQSSIWNLSALEYFFSKSKNQVLKLYILRVYRLSIPHVVNVATSSGFFYWSKTVLNTASDDDVPVINTPSFSERRKLLLAGKVYSHLDLEALQLQIQLAAQHNPNFEQLNYDIQQFLGCYCYTPTLQKSSKSIWDRISELGDRSQEQEQKKSHYQAGTDFENITREALKFIGFKVDESHKGGAGGLDLYCSQPYPLVIECKSGKSIPSRTVEELIKLGLIHLGRDELINSHKLIVSPNNANPTLDTKKAAKEFKVSIIKAMSLQKLAELQEKYPGSINLIELKPYLTPGVIDNQIQEYVDKVNKDIKVRSYIVKAVKELGIPGSEHESDAIAAVYNCNCRLATQEDLKLDTSTVHDILIELSSPLTGYLGRIKGTDWKTDKFYFLRDL
ncbi:MAG: DUF1802 family protein [Rivularia sp. (in: Bacteria)]|nr:DUF1802 family protein [Rivularia sp. MS3]